MKQLSYIYRFFNKIKWWLLIIPLLISSIVILCTRHLNLEYSVETTIYTGVVSSYGLDPEQPTTQNWNILNLKKR